MAKTKSEPRKAAAAKSKGKKPSSKANSKKKKPVSSRRKVKPRRFAGAAPIADVVSTFNKLTPRWYRNAGATSVNIRKAERASQRTFPVVYKAFLEWSNGGEGKFGEWYVSLWSTDKIASLNADYQIAKYIEGILGIGTDGGGSCYGLDYRQHDEDPPVIFVPLGDLDPESVTSVSNNFAEWIEKLIG